jgi:dihydrofolate reductase
MANNMITLIAAIGSNNEIGYKNRLLWNIPEDMKHFRSYTMGKTIVMGSNTFASIGSTPLPGRKNIVVSSQELRCLTAIHARSIEDALSVEHCYPEIVVIGGESIYRQTIDRADKLVITHVNSAFVADSFFPIIDPDIWVKTSIINSSNSDYSYSFVEYRKNGITQKY